VTNGTEHSEWIAQVREAVRRTDSRAFLVPARIVRRVIKEDRGLPGVGFRIPHRKSYMLSGTRTGHFVDKDELGLTIAEDYPPHVFLLAEPKESELQGMTQAELRQWAWRLLFHTRIHFEFERLFIDGNLRPADVRAAVGSIGQVEFDEVDSVLRAEQFLTSRADRTEAFVEFAAVYWEYRYFAPQRLEWYFPSLPPLEQVDEILRTALDVSSLVEETRPVMDTDEPDTPSGDSGADGRQKTTEAEGTSPAFSAATFSAAETDDSDVPLNARRFERLAASADKAAVRGNIARAAILHARAFACGTAQQRADAAQSVHRLQGELAARLQQVFGLGAQQAEEWRDVLGELVKASREGFWNADRRLLYDLQNTCVDHERDIYRIDLFGWATSLGKKPVKRPLPFQREVLTVKHLRSALRRLHSSRLPEASLQQLSRLLHEVVGIGEGRLRERLRPVVRASLKEVGFAPHHPVESVGFAKLTEEILDDVSKQGYVNMGSLRDAISRNQVKLSDLDGPRELLRGDQLLQANQQLADDLEGVYRRGEFYLRWLQRLSAVAFGTQTGRWLTLFALIPFGGAYIVLSFLAHLLHKLGGEASILTSWSAIGIGGVFLLGLIHLPRFRRGMWLVCSAVLRGLASIFIDMPVWAIRSPVVREILRSRPVVLVRRFVITPAVLTLLVCLAFPRFGFYPQPSLMWTVVIYLLLTAALNSRVSRDLEEISVDWMEQTWYRLRVRVFVALFEWVMSVFQTMLEFVERGLYAVDEWLRFRSGESRVTFALKAVFGLFWTAVSFVATFCVTLLIEPQINPIKHFPVVTVSHKIILPLETHIQAPLAGPFDKTTAHLLAIAIVTSLPGVFGFLVWELRANWRLYAANRKRTLQPVIVGHHGETIIRLLKPGFHSGTLPKLFGKIRRAVRRMTPLQHLELSALQPRKPSARTTISTPRPQTTRSNNGRPLPSPIEPLQIPQTYTESLETIKEAVRRFIEREFIALLEGTRAVPAGSLTVEVVTPASNSLQATIRHDDTSIDSPLTVVFQEQSGRLVSGVLQPGWLAGLDAERRRIVATALIGLYHLSGVDLVREQITSCLQADHIRYDVDGHTLVVWPDERYELEVRYNLDERPQLIPFPPLSTDEFRAPALPAEKVIFAEQSLSWRRWSEYWEAVSSGDHNASAAPQPDNVLPVASSS